MRHPEPDFSYTPGFFTSRELLLGPLFAVFGTLLASVWFIESSRPGSSTPKVIALVFILFVLFGLVLSYIAYFRWEYRLDVIGETLYVSTVLHRRLGDALVADVVSVEKQATYNILISATVITLRDGREIRIRNRRGIRTFVTSLRGISPDIEVDDWYAETPFDGLDVTFRLNGRDDDWGGN